MSALKRCTLVALVAGTIGCPPAFAAKQAATGRKPLKKVEKVAAILTGIGSTIVAAAASLPSVPWAKALSANDLSSGSLIKLASDGRIIGHIDPRGHTVITGVFSQDTNPEVHIVNGGGNIITDSSWNEVIRQAPLVSASSGPTNVQYVMSDTFGHISNAATGKALVGWHAIVGPHGQVLGASDGVHFNPSFFLVDPKQLAYALDANHHLIPLGTLEHAKTLIANGQLHFSPDGAPILSHIQGVLGNPSAPPVTPGGGHTTILPSNTPLDNSTIAPPPPGSENHLLASHVTPSHVDPNAMVVKAQSVVHHLTSVDWTVKSGALMHSLMTLDPTHALHLVGL